jgi:hypothetical protein
MGSTGRHENNIAIGPSEEARYGRAQMTAEAKQIGAISPKSRTPE